MMFFGTVVGLLIIYCVIFPGHAGKDIAEAVKGYRKYMNTPNKDGE